MNTGLEAGNPTIVAAFHSALLRQGVIIIAILALIGFAYLIIQSLSPSAGAADAGSGSRHGLGSGVGGVEPAARRLLRYSFGAIWILDGVLQAQPSMPLGMVPQVIEPAAAASPHWVQHLDNTMVTIWSNHPVTAAAAAVWIQVGIGVWLLAAPRGTWSRLAGVASVLWGLNVWAFGEAFGGIFAPGLSWMFGAPGAAIFYCAAGVLIALRESAWSTPRTGRIVLRLVGVFLLGMAVLQAWPGRGFWQGRLGHGTPGTLTTMVNEMSQTAQPHALSSLLRSFEGFAASNGLAVNLFVVIALAGIGAAFLTARASIVRPAVIAGIVLCLADWVLVQDMGFFGGVGTDPNSMIPLVLIFTAGYVAITRVPAPAGEPAQASRVEVQSGASRTGLVVPRLGFRWLAALGALAITLVGAIPMAVAATRSHADPIIAQALDGIPNEVSLPARPFTLVDQHGQSVSLAGLRGKTIAITFLDDVCTSDCPIIAQEFRDADGMLGSDASHVEMIAVNANPVYLAPDYLATFDEHEHMDGLRNWLYLTGSLTQLKHVWDAYGASVEASPGGAMINHSDSADVIGPDGRIHYVLDTDPGPGTEATKSSFAVTLAEAIKSTLSAS